PTPAASPPAGTSAETAGWWRASCSKARPASCASRGRRAAEPPAPQSATALPAPDIADLIRLFDDEFRASHNTVLVRGGDEPIYLPADEQHPQHRVIFAHGFYASALHEIAHWCIAGPERRLLVDYGYWYRPDGRTEAEQAE